MFCKKEVLGNVAKFTGKHLCQSLFFNKVSGQSDSGTMFSCEFCEISKNTFSSGHLWRSTMTKTWADFHKVTFAVIKANSEKETPNKVK